MIRQTTDNSYNRSFRDWSEGKWNQFHKHQILAHSRSAIRGILKFNRPWQLLSRMDNCLKPNSCKINKHKCSLRRLKTAPITTAIDFPQRPKMLTSPHSLLLSTVKTLTSRTRTWFWSMIKAANSMNKTAYQLCSIKATHHTSLTNSMIKAANLVLVLKPMLHKMKRPREFPK